MSAGCVFCQIKEGEIGKLDDYVGSCPNCGDGKYPKEIIVEYKEKNGIMHVFIPIGIIYCEGCGTLIKDINVYCSAEGLDVTDEFLSIGEKK